MLQASKSAMLSWTAEATASAISIQQLRVRNSSENYLWKDFFWFSIFFPFRGLIFQACITLPTFAFLRKWQVLALIKAYQRKSLGFGGGWLNWRHNTLASSRLNRRGCYERYRNILKKVLLASFEGPCCYLRRL